MYKAYKKIKVVYREKVGHCVGCKYWKKEKVKVMRCRYRIFFEEITDEVIEEYWGMCNRTHSGTHSSYFCASFKRSSKVFYK